MFVEQVLIPEYTRGKRRTRNPVHRRVEADILQGNWSGALTVCHSMIWGALRSSVRCWPPRS